MDLEGVSGGGGGRKEEEGGRGGEAGGRRGREAGGEAGQGGGLAYAASSAIARVSFVCVHPPSESLHCQSLAHALLSFKIKYINNTLIQGPLMLRPSLRSIPEYQTQCAPFSSSRGESPSGTYYGGSRLLHLGSAVALGVLIVHGVSP